MKNVSNTEAELKKIVAYIYIYIYIYSVYSNACSKFFIVTIMTELKDIKESYDPS